MTFSGHTHPLLGHFPIGLILMAAAAEALAILTRGERWRVAVGAALATGEAARRSAAGRWMYRIALFGAAGLVAVAGHPGGLLV